MRSGQPKQLLRIGSMTVLGHTITRILRVQSVRRLVIPAADDLAGQVADIATACIEASGRKEEVELTMVPGGAERMHSVGNGLDALAGSGTGLVMVHDAVRPCFPLDAVERALHTAEQYGAAILGVPARDTVKLVDEEHRITATPDRNKVWLAQTPQVFRLEVLVQAYARSGEGGLAATDDASLVEAAGFEVRVLEGSHDNIKITYAPDLVFAEHWLKHNP